MPSKAVKPYICYKNNNHIIDYKCALCYHNFRLQYAIIKEDKMVQQVSDFELELMKVIWGNGGTALYAEIVDGLESKGITATKNTIVSLLSRLVEKEFLKTNKIGRKNKYTSIVSEIEYQSVQTKTFLNKIYEGNAKDMISTLIQKDLISIEDYEDLKKYWAGSELH